jgi:hypothetical protein
MGNAHNGYMPTALKPVFRLSPGSGGVGIGGHGGGGTDSLGWKYEQRSILSIYNSAVLVPNIIRFTPFGYKGWQSDRELSRSGINKPLAGL